MDSMKPKNSHLPGGKKKWNKKKNSSNEKRTNSTQKNQEGGTKEKRKSRFPCMICGEDHLITNSLIRMNSLEYWHKNGPHKYCCSNPSFCWLWSLIMFLIQRSLLSIVFIPHEDFTPQKYVHTSTRESVEEGYPLCGVWGVGGRSPRRKNCLVNVYCNFIVNLHHSL
jgi:hypothetical protein